MSTVTIEMPQRVWKKLERFLEKFEETELTEWITEDEAAKALRIEKVTLRNYVGLGKIRVEWYKTGANGKRLYDKAAILGFKK